MDGPTFRIELCKSPFRLPSESWSDPVEASNHAKSGSHSLKAPKKAFDSEPLQETFGLE